MAALSAEVRNRITAIRASGLWVDKEYDFLMEAALKKQDPVIHYLTDGEARGGRPSRQFDPDYYRRKHGITGDSPLLHYILFGRQMGLRTLPVATEFAFIETGFREGYKRVLVLGPDEDDAIAKKAMVRLLRELRKTIDVIVLRLDAGSSDTELHDVAACVASPGPRVERTWRSDQFELAYLIAELRDYFRPGSVVCCSIRAEHLVRLMLAKFIPTLTLTFRDVASRSERNRFQLYRHSAAIFFPAEHVRANHVACYPWIASRRTAVVPFDSDEQSQSGRNASVVLKALDEIESLVADLATRYKHIESLNLSREPLWEHVYLPREYKSRLRENCYLGGLATGGTPDFPVPRLLTGFKSRHYTAARGQTEGNPVISYLAEDRSDDFLSPIISPTPGPAETSNCRVAIHGHYHYTDVAIELFEALAVNRVFPDLFLSTNTDTKAQELSSIASKYSRTAVIRVVPNKGRDLGSFLTGYRDLFESGYDVIGHVHGKKSTHMNADFGTRWRQLLLEHTVGGQYATADAVLAAFSRDQRLGLVFPEDDQCLGWDKTHHIARYLGKRMKIADRLNCSSFDFPAGSFFWCRPQALRPLLDLRLDWQDYPEEPIEPDGTILHAIERLIPFACEASEFEYRTVHIPGLDRRRPRASSEIKGPSKPQSIAAKGLSL